MVEKLVGEIIDNSFHPQHQRKQITECRIRYFLEFVSPTLLSIKDEITVYNIGNDSNFFKYLLDEFKSNLHIKDSNGDFLEFTGNDENKTGEHEIIVYFPDDRKLKKEEYRTISFEYTKKVQFKFSYYPKMLLKMKFKRFRNSNTYVFIKQCDEYEFDVFCEDVMDDILKGSIFYELSIKSTNSQEDILVLIWHHIPTSILYWYYLGTLFGFSLLFLIPISYHFNPDGIRDYILLASVSVTFLVFIKGLLFQKKMDRQLKFFDLAQSAIVFCIFLEIIGMISDALFSTAFNVHLIQIPYISYSSIASFVFSYHNYH